MDRRLAALAVLAALGACSEREPAAPAAAAPEAGPATFAPAETPPKVIVPKATDAPAGAYKLDKAHASLTFKVDHIGFSDYTGSFQRFDADLHFDPANPSAMAVVGTVDLASLTIPAPPEGFLAELLSAPWLGADAHPEAVFRSTRATLVDEDTARVEGELEFRAMKAPVEMIVDFNGGYAGFPPYDPNARIGFSARGTLSRSAFGMTTALPPEGSSMGVGDAVAFEIEAEFQGPPSQ